MGRATLRCTGRSRRRGGESADDAQHGQLKQRLTESKQRERLDNLDAPFREEECRPQLPATDSAANMVQFHLQNGVEQMKPLRLLSQERAVCGALRQVFMHNIFAPEA